MLAPTPRLAPALGILIVLSAPLARAQEDSAANWPVELQAEGSTVVLYQPQIESFENDRLQSRAAVSVTTEAGGAPRFGAVWLDALVATDVDTRLVSFPEVRVSAVKFPDATEENVARLSAFLEKELPLWDITMTIDELVANAALADDRSGETGLKNDPPEIIVRDRPAVLVLIDGEPRIERLEGYDVDYVVNTTYFILRNGARYYLRGGEIWYSSTDLTGDWTPVDSLPGNLSEVARAVEAQVDEQRAEQDEVMEEASSGSEVEDSVVPEIIVRTEPAELLLTDGAPDFAPIEGTSLLYLRDTESDVLMDIDSQTYYVLLAGRWYAATSLEGPWQFVEPADLPAGFAQIPADSDMGNVRSSVVGTQEAKEAILSNSVPEMAEVDRSAATVEVNYDGTPQFKSCGSEVQWAENSDKAVLKIAGTYYCCDDAVWFVADDPRGPWKIATSVPSAVQDIPAECPVSNVKYVQVYDSTPDVVYVGYTPGYTGAYVYGGTVVYGTGWWYRPWYGHYYYPRRVTWGFNVHYNPYTGWGFSFGASVGWLHISVGRPYYGGWWGPAGYRYGYRHGYHHGYHHGYRRGAQAGFRAGYRAGHHANQGSLYSKRERQGVARDASRRRTKPTATPAQRPAARTPSRSTRPNDVYTDRQGNVFRDKGRGEWETRDRSGWSTSKADRSSRENLDRDRTARQRGVQRNQQATPRRSGGGRARGGRGRG